MKAYLISATLFFLIFAEQTIYADPCRSECEARSRRCHRECSINDYECPRNCSLNYQRCIASCPAEAPELAPGDVVEVIVASNLYIGTQVVGHVEVGEQFILSSIYREWASMKKIDGTDVRGWIMFANLRAPNGTTTTDVRTP